jgi:hypothetical protein
MHIFARYRKKVQRNRKTKERLALLLLTLACCLLVPLAYASVTLPPTWNGGYENGTFINHPGTYSNVSRINGVWLFNGAPYPTPPIIVPSGGGGGLSSPTPASSGNPNFPRVTRDQVLIAFMVVMALGGFAVLVSKKGEKKK